MSINIGDNFKYLGKKFLDNRESFDTLQAMKDCEIVPDGFITYCKEDKKRYEFNSSNNINELTGKWTEFSVKSTGDHYLGIDEPLENDAIWFFDSRESASNDITYDNPIIAELFACIQSLQAQITELQAEVEYLQINGGGGIPIEPPDGGGSLPDEEITNIFFALEDGGYFILEDESGYLILEEEIKATNQPTLILEDGAHFLLEDGSFMLLEETIVDTKDNVMLLESGDELLLENSYNILIES